VRCGSRVKSRCESCAELYRGDWAAITRSGVFDGPAAEYCFYQLTLLHPRSDVYIVFRATAEVVGKCGCGDHHGAPDAGLRGVPLNPSTYDYSGRVSWNPDAGLLWDRTRRRIRDRWGSFEYFIVPEGHPRGEVHRLYRVEQAAPARKGGSALPRATGPECVGKQRYDRGDASARRSACGVLAGEGIWPTSWPPWR
jgi:hypothetical protein